MSFEDSYNASPRYLRQNLYHSRSTESASKWLAFM